MKNLEQIRAMNALASVKSGVQGKGINAGDALSGFPALVVNNGLLATIAFSKKQKGGHLEICDALARHLAHKDIARLPPSADDTDGMLKHLTENDSAVLRLCTAESLAFLNYLRRFAKAQE